MFSSEDDESTLMNFSSKIGKKKTRRRIYMYIRINVLYVLIGCFLMSGTTGWGVILYVRISVKKNY